MTAQRKALRRAQAETSSKYPAIGAYQSAATPRIDTISASILAQAAMSQTNLGPAASPRAQRRPQPPAYSRSVTMAAANTPSGTMTSATSTFERTVGASETGSDFQKRMLRSLRSSYSEDSR